MYTRNSILLLLFFWTAIYPPYSLSSLPTWRRWLVIAQLSLSFFFPPSLKYRLHLFVKSFVSRLFFFLLMFLFHVRLYLSSPLFFLFYFRPHDFFPRGETTTTTCRDTLVHADTHTQKKKNQSSNKIKEREKSLHDHAHHWLSVDKRRQPLGRLFVCWKENNDDDDTTKYLIWTGERKNK